MGEYPSAFPYAVSESDAYGENGMTLRDWFAGQVMASMLGATMGDGPPSDGMTPERLAKGFASASYLFADAMLEARARTDTGEG